MKTAEELARLFTADWRQWQLDKFARIVQRDALEAAAAAYEARMAVSPPRMNALRRVLGMVAADIRKMKP